VPSSINRDAAAMASWCGVEEFLIRGPDRTQDGRVIPAADPRR
jgi:hypothetical protein